MIFSFQNTQLSTQQNTRLKSVLMLTISYYPRKDKIKNGTMPIYIRISKPSYKPIRLNTFIYVGVENWNSEKQCVRNDSNSALLLDNIKARLTDIQIVYKLSDIVLTPELLLEEYLGKMNKTNFISFFREQMELEKKNIGTYKRYKSVLEKLKGFREYLPFHDITLKFIDKYKHHLRNVHKNEYTTINSNLSIIKKFLGVAQKNKIKLTFDLDDLKIGSTLGNRNYLNEDELRKCMKYYQSEFINDAHRLVLGYFLFGCLTGLRISNIKGLRRKDLLGNDFSTIIVKSNKDRIISLNNNCKKVIQFCPELFEKFFTNEYMNREIKVIMHQLQITKSVSFHVARHTFATLFLKLNGNVVDLQKILGHSKIEQTMIYVHIVQEDANKAIFLMDQLF